MPPAMPKSYFRTIGSVGSPYVGQSKEQSDMPSVPSETPNNHRCRKRGKRYRKRRRLYEEDRHCYWCGDEFRNLNKTTLDHVLPESKGGTLTNDNLVLSCRHCNNLKGGNIWLKDSHDNIWVVVVTYHKCKIEIEMSLL